MAEGAGAGAVVNATWPPSSGHPPPMEAPGKGRRRWQQHHQSHYASPALPSLPPFPNLEAVKRSAALAFPAQQQQQQQQRLLWPCPGMGARSWRCPRRRRWRLLAAGLTCCTVLALYASSSSLSSSSSSSSILPSLLQDHWLPQREEEEEEEDEDEGAKGSPLTILLWWEPFGRSRALGDCQRRFNVTACRLTTDHSQLPQAQAVLFHHRDLVLHGTAQLPRARPAAQRWVWMNFESPSHTRGLRDLRGIFNWTMSYRVDSDVFVPYGYLRPSRAPALDRLALPKKNKLVAWVISNWNEDHARVRYYHQLKNYLPIDVYGAQGLELKDNNVVQTVSEYKFYLAFENSQHQDYITEKLWRNAFKAWAVPVVLGPPRSNYELFIPSDSFIHVDDFSDAEQLAVYLKFLDKNKSRYRKYFAWRKHYDVQVTSFWDEHCCRVCDVVRTSGKKPKTIQNLANWFES